MKRLVHTLLFLALCISVEAQVYSNEWIQFPNRYYKFPIVQTGFYRIDSAALANSGIPLSGINPKNFQLFIKGQEQYVFVNGESDNVFNTGDYIEFYAEKNDGRFDSTLYENISYVPNPYVSLLSDTIYGFLTWNNSISNKRLTIENDTASALYTPASYFYTEKVYVGNGIYNPVEEYPDDASDPRYTQAEGYGAVISNGQLINSGFTGINMYNSAALPVTVRVAFSGASISNYVYQDHEIKGVIYDASNSPVTLFDTIFSGYKAKRYTFNLMSNTLGNNSNIELSFVNNPMFASITSYAMVHYMYYKYPQTPDLANNSFYNLLVDNDPTFSKTFLKLSSVNTGTANAILFYDLTNHKRIDSKIGGGFTKILVPNAGGQKRCYLSSVQNVMMVPKVYPVNQTGYFTNYKATLADSAFVIITHSSLMGSATSYKTYRQSMAGGGHAVVLADIDDLYDQFAYGIKKHPLSIRNFMRFLIDSLPSPPKYLLLLGKSVQNRELRDVPGAWDKCLIPTMGWPPSDNLLTSRLKTNTSIIPEVPVGRISAQSNTEVSWYLSKIQQHESTGPADWKKHVLHFAGGTTDSERSQFQSYLKAYETTIKDTLFGGEVFNFYKTTTAPIQITVSDSVFRHFNYGVSLVTFFGHGSYTGFDQAIDDPNSYSNAGKYPLFIANSCYSGNIHTATVRSTSENFTLINNKGTIGFLAASSLGFVYNLSVYSGAIYNAIGKTRYNKSIGAQVQLACTSSAGPDKLQEITALDMTLESDPSIVIGNGNLPDYEISNSSVNFDQKKYVDSVGIAIEITNIGKAIRDSMIVKVERYFPNNDSITYYKKVATPLYKDTLSFYMPIDYSRGLGLNKFVVKVDNYNQIPELAENNNSTTGTIDYFIQGGDIVPVVPYKYEIVPNTPTITLKASTSNPFDPPRNYRFELDTTDAFTAPLQTALINSAGGVVEWTVSLPLPDSTVYYWRVSKDSTSASDGFVWRESSFQVIGNKHGWGQAHFFQFKNDGYRFVKYKRPVRRFDFLNDVISLTCRTGIIYNIDPLNIIYSMNSSVMQTWNCSYDGWTIAVFDSISCQPWIANPTTTNAPSPGTSGNCNCVNSGQSLFAFDFGATSYCTGLPSWQPALQAFLNSVPPNNYVLAYSAQSHTASSYSNGLYTAFESIGSANIRTLQDTLPLIIFGRKGMSIGQAHEVKALNSKVPIELNDSLRTRWYNGYIASEIIGPAYKWNSLHWRVGTLDATPGDTTVLKVIGIKTNGQRDTLAAFKADSLNVLDLYNYADASVYPTMQLVAMMKDNVNRTSPQLKRWQVLYDEAPECAINPKKGFVVKNDSLQEGDNVTFYMPVENIGTLPFTDSLVFTYWIEDANRVNHPLPQKMKAKPFNPAAIIMDTIRLNSYQFPGSNALWIDVNPPQNSRYQKEENHFNNVARYPFTVSKDVTNPLLDVTFDGVRIMNGDVVSARPGILIALKDENKFLALNDTASFNVFLQKPNDPLEQRIYFANGLQFTPAQLPANSCKINYNPVLPADGKYTLRVQAKDRSNNQSGAVDYRVMFEIVNKPSITQVINYPNPFSTSTRFVFNLTGSEVPEVFNIQIMTISGKIVKTIMKEDLGPIHIGRNISQYAWDGKDDFGDRLGNGVYLYKVNTRLNGQSIEKQSTEADQYFTKEIGKMVIMR